MIETIQPRQYFPISRLLTDPADSNTYYIRALIKNARTGAIIETVSLANISDRLYVYSWQAVADPSGQGLFITITTEVYTDSGYTTKSDAYQEEHSTFLIYDRFNMVQSLANQISALSTPDEVDYKRIKEMIQSAVKAIIDAIPKIKDPEKVDLGPTNTMIGHIKEKVDAMKPCEHKGGDMAPVIEAVIASEKSIRRDIKDLPRFEKTDLSPVIDEVKKIDWSSLSTIIESTSDTFSDIKKYLSQDISKVSGALDKIFVALDKVRGAVFETLYNMDKTNKEQSKEPKKVLSRSGRVIERP